MTNQQKIKKLYSLHGEIEANGRTLGKLSFDMEC